MVMEKNKRKMSKRSKQTPLQRSSTDGKKTKKKQTKKQTHKKIFNIMTLENCKLKVRCHTQLLEP